MLVHSYLCKGDIECLSDIAYDKHYRLFASAMNIIAVCLFFATIDKTPESYQFLCFLASVGCIGVGITPYKECGSIHKGCALVAMISVLGLWIVKGMWYMPFLFCLAGLRKKWLLGIEMGVLTSAFAYALI